MFSSKEFIESKMSDDDKTRDEIEETINDEPGQEPAQEEETKPVAKAKSISAI